MHAFLKLNAGCGLCIYLDGARLYAWMYMSICVNILENIIRNGYTKYVNIYYIYIYIYICVYMIYGYLQDLFKENF